MSNTDKLSTAEIDSIVETLAKLDPGVLPAKVFHAIARIVATPIIEVVPIRHGAAGPEVLLVRRESNDPVWPNQLHVPGTVVRASDKADNFKDAFERISGELGGIMLKKPVLATNIIHHSGRGVEVSQIYWIDITGVEPTIGDFFAADKLPEEIVHSQLDFIPAAVAHFVAYHSDLN